MFWIYLSSLINISSFQMRCKSMPQVSYALDLGWLRLGGVSADRCVVKVGGFSIVSGCPKGRYLCWNHRSAKGGCVGQPRAIIFSHQRSIMQPQESWVRMLWGTQGPGAALWIFWPWDVNAVASRLVLCPNATPKTVNNPIASEAFYITSEHPQSYWSVSQSQVDDATPLWQLSKVQDAQTCTNCMFYIYDLHGTVCLWIRGPKI